MSKKTEPRRIRRAMIRPGLLSQILNQRIAANYQLGTERTIQVYTLNLPKDAKVAHLNWDATEAGWWVFFESEEFEPVEEDRLIPEFDLSITEMAAKLIDPTQGQR